MHKFILSCIVPLGLTYALGALAQAQAQTPTPAPAPAPAPTDAPKAAPAPPSTIVTIGKERKRTIGRLNDLERGDNGCYLTLKDDKDFEFIEVGTFEMCEQKPSPKGKKVELTYKLEPIQASSCDGDKRCTKTEMVALVVGMKVVE